MSRAHRARSPSAREACGSGAIGSTQSGTTPILSDTSITPPVGSMWSGLDTTPSNIPATFQTQPTQPVKTGYTDYFAGIPLSDAGSGIMSYLLIFFACTIYFRRGRITNRPISLSSLPVFPTLAYLQNFQNLLSPAAPTVSPSCPTHSSSTVAIV